MLLRFLCPQCRVSMDPGRVELGSDGLNDYRICPECDAVLLVSVPAVPCASADPADPADPCRQAVPA